MYPKFTVTKDGNGDVWATDMYGIKRRIEPFDSVSTTRLSNLAPGVSLPATGNSCSYLALKGLGPDLTTASSMNFTFWRLP